MNDKETAIWVRGLTKKYGRSRKAQLVLDQLDMTVEKGTIYGLLGASGCGKTTLLTCIMGRRSVTAGEIWILGGKPGSQKSGVPGPQLGYMPQEIALMKQFTIADAVYHFGWIYGMKNEEIEERLTFLADLLELPSLGMKVQNLSGGQQRRVSMAVALIQDPELIILDEPTVGLDPVLRDKIWKYLKECVTQRNRTVIITTHYIEEARQAHKVGLMRNGKLLAEDSPQRLMEMFECTDLEHVFLKLSDQQEKTAGKPQVDHQQPSSSRKLDVVNVVDTNEVPDRGKRLVESTSGVPSVPQPETAGNSNASISKPNESTTMRFKRLFKGHAKALLSKNWYRITRHPGAIVFVFLFPMVELCSFYLAVGGDPQGLKLGVVNDELGNFSSCDQLRQSLGSQYGGHKIYVEDGLAHCVLEGLSCKFLDKIHDDVVVKTPYSDISTALSDAKKGRLLAVIHFLGNFSKAFESRIEAGGDTSDEVIEESQIALWLDMSQRQSALLLERRLLKLQVEWLNETFQECQINPQVASIPVRINPAVYGRPESGFNQFMTPGVVTTMIFFLAVSITSTIMLVERLDGVWDRTLLAGVSSVEILVSHIILESGVICLQVLEVFIFVFFIFGMPCAGRYIDIVILLVLQGFCGMCGGFLVSVSVNSVTTSNFVSMGGFYPIIVFSGLLWPIEGMPGIMRKIAVGMPTTMATLSLRNIMEKGWTLTRTYVYEGYLISLAWIMFFSIASILVVRARK